MARGVFAQFTKEANTTLRYRYVCEACGELTTWFTAHMRHKSNVISRIGFLNAGSRLIETPEMVERGQIAVDKRLNNAIETINIAIKERAIDVVFPGDPFLADAYNNIFQHGETCPHCGEQQTWYPAVSDIKSTVKSIRNNAIIFAGLGVIVAMLAQDNFAYFWAIPLGAMPLGGGIGWLLANEEIRQKKKFADKHTTHNNPEIEWNYVPTADDEIVKDTLAESIPKMPVTEQQISINTASANFDIYRQLLGKEHLNILSVKKVNADNLIFEDFSGITLTERLKSKLSVHDFEDYFQQICDALEFLHSQKKPISYNNLTADNIVIGEDNLLKLFNFNKADNTTPITSDIEAIASLMLTINEKYIKRYKSITKPCFNGTFKNFDEINTAISKNVRNRLGIRYSLLATGIMILFMFRRVGSRLIPMFEQLFSEIWKLIFGT